MSITLQWHFPYRLELRQTPISQITNIWCAWICAPRPNNIMLIFPFQYIGLAKPTKRWPYDADQVMTWCALWINDKQSQTIKTAFQRSRPYICLCTFTRECPNIICRICLPSMRKFVGSTHSIPFGSHELSTGEFMGSLTFECHSILIEYMWLSSHCTVSGQFSRLINR